MSKLDKLRFRYLKDPIPTRIGGLAANLSRVASFSKHDDHQHVVASTMKESKWFIEWTVGDLPIEQSASLVQLQTQLALWELQSTKCWQDEQWRHALIRNAEQWSTDLIEMSGLTKV